jgi:hypothetical protein
MTLEEMQARRDALLAARFRGVRTVEVDLERRIARIDPGGRRRIVHTAASKGL